MFDLVSLSARYMIMSAMGFALMAVCVKVASVDGIPVLEIVAARALVSLLLSYADVRRKGISPWGHNKLWLFARGMTGALALVCVYFAVTVMPLAEATVLQYLHPMFTAILAMVFLKERLQAATFLCIVFSFLGLLFIARPEFLFGSTFGLSEGQGHYSMFAVWVAVLGAFGSGAAYVMVKKLSSTEDVSVIILYFPLVALPFSLLLLGGDFVMPQGSTWLTLLAVGIFTQVGQFGLTKALQTETASKATAFAYLQVVFSAALGWFLFDEIPVVWTWIGAGLIVIGALANMFWRK